MTEPEVAELERWAEDLNVYPHKMAKDVLALCAAWREAMATVQDYREHIVVQDAEIARLTARVRELEQATGVTVWPASEPIKEPPPHGPVSERTMRKYYGAKAMSEPVDLDALERRLTSVVGRSLRRIAERGRLSSLDVPMLEEAADELDRLTERVREAEAGQQVVDEWERQHQPEQKPTGG